MLKDSWISSLRPYEDKSYAKFGDILFVVPKSEPSKLLFLTDAASYHLIKGFNLLKLKADIFTNFVEIYDDRLIRRSSLAKELSHILTQEEIQSNQVKSPLLFVPTLKLKELI